MKLSVMNAYQADEKILNEAGYIYEPKLDGFRALCFVNSSMKFISRNDIDITDKFFKDADFRKNIKAKTCVLDGEIVAYDKAGKPSFNLLKNGAQAHYIVFDILMKDGKSLTNKPLLERKKILDEVLSDGDYIQKIPYTKQGKLLWNKVVTYGLEGVMAKEVDSIYYPGERSHVWLKIKLLNTLDAVIVGYKTGKRIISSLALGLYDDQGVLTYIGNVGTGFNDALLEELYPKLHSLETKMAPIKKTDSDVDAIIWMKPKLVCEVKYQQITSYNILRIASFLRLRIDKKPADCKFDQFPI